MGRINGNLSGDSGNKLECLRGLEYSKCLSGVSVK